MQTKFMCVGAFLTGTALAAGMALAQGSGAAGETVRVQVTPEVCERLILQHRPAADVAYRPGVDAQGNPVVSADLTPNPIALPRFYEFDINVDPLDFQAQQQVRAARAAFEQQEVDDRLRAETVTADLATLQAEATALTAQQTALQGQLNAIDAQFDARRTEIINDTGGPGATDAGLLATRAQALAALDTSIRSRPDFKQVNAQLTDVNSQIAANTALQSTAQNTLTALGDGTLGSTELVLAAADLVAAASALNTQLTALQTERATIDAQFDTRRSEIVADTGGTGETDAGRLATRAQALAALDNSIQNRPDYKDVQERIDAVNTQIAVNTAAQAANTAAQDALLTNTQTEDVLEATEAALANSTISAANTTIAVGKVRIDLETGETLFNGQPIGGGVSAEVAAACAALRARQNQ